MFDLRDFPYSVHQQFDDAWYCVALFSNGGDAATFEGSMRTEFPHLAWKLEYNAQGVTDEHVF